MADLKIQGLAKSYKDVRVLESIDLDIASGEFFTLLGPSGCGKTTLLRTIAGFQHQDRGEIVVNGERIDHKPAHKRDIGMVFQDYAIFPHLTVAENVAFGLKARALPKSEIEARVAESLKMVRLDGYQNRLPAEMSGGQQQRIGLARAMAIRPTLLLMDEPLSNLDAKLRIELREDIRDIQRRLGITTIYVTHDQEEALAVSDRICVMNKGNVEQIGTPFEIYRKPLRKFAASFVGTMNFLPGRIEGGRLIVGTQSAASPANESGPVEVAIRPENVQLSLGHADSEAIALKGEVLKVTFLGREAHYTLKTEVGEVVAQVADPEHDFIEMEGRPVEVRLPLSKIVLFRSNGDVIGAGQA
ncbi:ABC transporter ATP-binding protein [Microvirga guangxiensis]|uniref:Iron(III) transport system ATP-binding protein n=1 Tax=Microvirga guangxiensis TaxID=549386 RepID=A0A1G5L380_9HYPH|nr:ABC transporter ATP-binding protein [Microvirga guangxiensis]SCZ07355.1 iron(III) transport system ATP-binding protein [Microvirga guangxiensis]